MPEPSPRTPVANAPLSVLLYVPPDQPFAESTLTAWQRYLTQRENETEIVLVLPATQDASRDERMGVTTIQPPRKGGVGTLLRAGLQAARHPLVAYCECTPAYDPSDLGKMLKAIDDVDLVAPYRELPTGKRRRSASDCLYGLFARIIFGLRLHDVDCAFKLFRRSVFDRIPIQSDGSFAQTEILAKANFLGCLMTEVGITYNPAPGATSEPPFSRTRRAEAYRVFRSPDFGLPPPREESAAHAAGRHAAEMNC